MKRKEMKEVIKPLTVARMDFRNSLLMLCNNSGLPLFCIEDILKEFTEQIHIAAIEQYERDKTDYESMLKNQNNNEQESIINKKESATNEGY